MTTPQPTTIVMCSRHRRRCGLSGNPARIAHQDGRYCDSQVFGVTERQQVNPETAFAVLVREQLKAAATEGKG